MLGTIVLILVVWFLISLPMSLLVGRLCLLGNPAYVTVRQEKIAPRRYSPKPF